MVAGIIGGLSGAYWARFGPAWRGWYWLSALVGAIILSGIMTAVLGLVAPRNPPRKAT